MGPGAAISWIWLAWVVSWTIGAIWADHSAKRARLGDELAYLLVQATAIFMVVLSGQRRWPYDPNLWDVGDFGAWALVGLVIAGLAFAWWARLTLGRLWSGNVARKREHRIIDTGPYALTRHPIYTGIIIAVFATAIAIGRPFAMAGFALIVIGIWMKARLEEKFLRAELGAAAYDQYAHRVPMLVPFLR